ncbi:hypothetical protein MMC22_001802 [Lobaria immixta]|nr:hypothetical protein [Lobaria immixta]
MANFKASILAGTYLLSTILLFVRSSLLHCEHSDIALQALDSIQNVLNDHRARKSLDPCDRRIAIEKVRVFDGQKILKPQIVFIDGEVVGTCGNEPIQRRCEDAEQAAAAPGSAVVKIPGFLQDELLDDPKQVLQFVKNRLAEEASYIKIIADDKGQPELSQTIGNALAVRRGLAAGADQLHHAPLDYPLDELTARSFHQDKRVLVPTLVMMQAILDQFAPGNRMYASARDSVTALYRQSRDFNPS